ncbi:uncharacterized protein LOC144822037 [Lissotriton helveticus]
MIWSVRDKLVSWRQPPAPMQKALQIPPHRTSVMLAPVLLQDEMATGQLEGEKQHLGRALLLLLVQLDHSRRERLICGAKAGAYPAGKPEAGDTGTGGEANKCKTVGPQCSRSTSASSLLAIPSLALPPANCYYLHYNRNRPLWPHILQRLDTIDGWLKSVEQNIDQLQSDVYNALFCPFLICYFCKRDLMNVGLG